MQPLTAIASGTPKRGLGPVTKPSSDMDMSSTITAPIGSTASSHGSMWAKRLALLMVLGTQEIGAPP